MRRFTFVALTLFLVLACTVLPLSAQSVDTSIQGTVLDATGAAIPNATITISNPATGANKTVTSSDTGAYLVNYLTPGTYDVKVTANGFTTYSQKGLVLSINQQAKIDVNMTVGGGTQVVEVTASQPLLQAENASLGEVVGPERAANLPLNGRKFNDLAVLTPGVTVSNPDNHSSSTAGSTVTSNGNQSTWGQAFLDGITMVNNRSAYINAYPSVDAIQEFSVLTGNYGAQYGGGAGAIVNIQLKSGGNQWHGSVFEFIRNDAVDARDFFRPAPLPKPILKQNQFGGVLTGPIVKDKTFFLFSYEGLRSIVQNVSTATVFTAAMRTGDFSAYSKQLVNPYNSNAPYAGNKIPTCPQRGCLDPNTVAIINTYMPLPNIAGTVTTTGPSNNYSGVQTGRQSNNQYLTRLDHHLSDKDQIAFHYLYQGRNFPLTGVNPAFSYTGTYVIHHTGAQWVHTFNQNLINEFRAGADLENVKQLPLGFYNSNFTAASIGIQQFTQNGQAGGPPLPPSQEGFPTLSINSYQGMGSGTAASNLDHSRTYQMTDNLTWIKGHHTLLVGIDIRQHSDNATTNNTPYGSMSFNGGYTGASAGDFLIGDPTSSTTPEGVPLTLARQWRSGYYVQDNWKVNNKLTVNAGLRYDLFLPPHNLLTSSRTLQMVGSTLTLVPLPDPLWQITHKDFAPRLGFAYSLPWKSVLRGGYSMTFYGGKFDNINILQLNPPIDNSFTIANGTVASGKNLATFELPAPATLTAASANVASLPLDGKRPDLYLQTFNLTLSKQFWNNVLDVSYVGVKGTHQDTSIPYWNSGPPNNGSVTAQANRPYTQFGRIRMVDFHGTSFFSSLQTKFEHKFSYGLSFSTAYTLGHLRDNQGGDTNGSRSQTQIPTAKEPADGNTDQRHYLTSGMVWSPTFHFGNKLVGYAANGWTLSSLFSFGTATPLFVSQSADGENNDNLFQRPDLNCAVGDLPLPSGQRTLAKWFHTECFTQANGHYGTTPRNPHSLRGPYKNPVTIGISRSFPVYREQKLLIRFEMFNALNEPQFGNPGATLGNSTFGQITGTAGGGLSSRQLQLSAKYSF